MEDKMLKRFLDTELWSRGIQHCIDKGIRPEELRAYTTPEFRCEIASIIIAKKYYIAPPHIALVPKDVPGEFRKIYVNTVLDRLILNILAEVYTEANKEKIHPHCVSYKKGMGVSKIIDKVLRYTSKENFTGYKIDISKYFDSVPREYLEKVLAEIFSGSCLDNIVWEYYHDDLILDENDQLQEKYKSLAQGCAMSPLLANLALKEVDAAMSKTCELYYRYSDDILLLGKGADEAFELLGKMLGEIGLKVNPKKVEKLSSEKWFTFLGCKIKGNRVSISKKSLETFQKEIQKRTVDKMPKNSKMDKRALKRAVQNIQRYLYTSYIKNSSNFGWAEYFFNIINCEEDIVEMDKWIKDTLRACLTGKTKVGGLGSIEGKDKTVARGKGKNVTANYEKTKGVLEDCGYVSMHHLYKVFHINKDVYRAEIRMQMM